MLEPKTRRQVIDMLIKKTPHKIIQNELGVSRNQVRHIADMTGLCQRHLTDDQKKQIVSMSLDGHYSPTISDVMGISTGRVVHTLKKSSLNKGRGRPCKAKQKTS